MAVQWTNPGGEIDETTTLKDLDLNFVFQLQKFWFNELIRQIDLDCKFLEREGIMDYSLLVGLHFCDDDTAAKMGMLQFVIPFSRKGLRLGERGNSEYCFLESGKNMDPVLACRLG